jgi:hypothetical protein
MIMKITYLSKTRSAADFFFEAMTTFLSVLELRLLKAVNLPQE